MEYMWHENRREDYGGKEGDQKEGARGEGKSMSK